jgi:hypothetical protein
MRQPWKGPLSAGSTARRRPRGDGDAAVGLLVVLEHGHHGAAHGHARAVERVHEFGLALGVAKPRLHAPGLEGLAVAAGADLAVGALPRQPDLEVIGLGGAEAHVAGAQRHHAVGQLQRLQHGLGVAHHLFQCGVAVLGVGYLHHLDLVELVLADHAARVAPGAAGLGAEAGAVRRQLDRQLRGVQDALAHAVGQADLAGGYEVLLLLRRLALARALGGRAASVDPEHVVLELGQLPGADQDLAVDDVGGVALGVAVLLGVQVQHELGERPVQPRHRPAQKGEARAREQRSGVEVQPQRSAQVDMVLDLEVEGARRAPAAHLGVALFAGAHGHAVVRQVGQAQHHVGQLGLHGLEALGRGFQLVAQAGHLGHDAGRVLALGLELADLTTQAVAPGLQFLGAGLDGLALGLEGREAGFIEKGLGVLAGLQPGDDAGQIATKLLDVEHERLRKTKICS